MSGATTPPDTARLSAGVAALWQSRQLVIRVAAAQFALATVTPTWPPTLAVEWQTSQMSVVASGAGVPELFGLL